MRTAPHGTGVSTAGTTRLAEVLAMKGQGWETKAVLGRRQDYP